MKTTDYLRELRKENIIFHNISLMQNINAKIDEFLLKETNEKEKKEHCKM